MPVSSNLLFVYGTLMRGHRRHRHLVEAGAVYVGCGSICGKLYRIPGEDYPGAVSSDNERQRVHGELYRLPQTPRALRLLDHAEGCREGQYRRELVSVRYAGTHINAWTYFYARPMSSPTQILNGRFRARS